MDELIKFVKEREEEMKSLIESRESIRYLFFVSSLTPDTSSLILILL